MADKSVYEKSEWVDTSFVQEYVDNAEGLKKIGVGGLSDEQ